MIITINNPNVWLIVRKGLRGAGRAASGKEKVRERERGGGEKRITKSSGSRAFQNLNVLSLLTWSLSSVQSLSRVLKFA